MDIKNYRFSIGDSVTMIGKVGNVTGRQSDGFLNYYSVHWIANKVFLLIIKEPSGKFRHMISSSN